MMRWFGSLRNAPAWEGMEEAPTPVGVQCEWCEETISDGDDGVVSGGYAYHGDCFVRTIVGGINHILGRCMCCGGDEPPDPPDVSRREAASAAVRAFEHRTNTRPEEN